ncbi:glutathione peroxidase [Pseudomonas sp. UBA2684]|uniref:glutathione peroxidase n=1 Tax=Pseudomonas sp. UBA2684 TaxID=1947311 RepID=UPI000E8DA835|nr:glutathione peroxidase [Pseudomonas sp. UBA2684]HBX54923.1 glutathione peroxidase [Pseudomonas sp.]|tara:strand:- start:7434 stop:8000 length:567 start_codon:yes stop_codon:yes gene_type:complete
MSLRTFVVPLLLGVLTLAVMPSASLAAECPALLQGELPKLRAKERIDLCSQFAGKPLVVVNTASFCGFTPQFKGLEALYQRYKGQGLQVLGVPSDDFKQESGDAEETATVCFVNYGVTFSMSETQIVTGAQAIPLFKELAAQSQAPRWNFAKYVVDRQGKVVASFSSRTQPDDPELIAAVEKAIASAP